MRVISMGQSAFSLDPFSSVREGPPVAPLPPPRINLLGRGRPAEPALSQGQAGDVRRMISDLVQAIQFDVEVLKAEDSAVEPATLRVEPDLARQIDVIGPVLSPFEIRSAIAAAARAVSAQADRVLSGAASGYLASDERATLRTAREDAQALVRHLGDLDSEPVRPEHAALANDYVEGHVGKIRDEGDALERAIATGEASSIPLKEPSPNPLTILVPIAILAAVVVIVVDMVI